MPYEMRTSGGQSCVHKVGDDKPMKCYDNKDDAKKYMAALMANVPDANKAKADMPTSADDYAYVPDKKTPSSWKLPIDTPEHIAGAITALTTGFRGNKVEIPAADKKTVVSRIRGAINKLSDKDQKANLLDRLDKVKSTEKAFTGLLEPEDVNYIPLSTTKGKACANCRWYIADAPTRIACYLVDASDEDDEPILATGYCDRWEATPAPKPDLTEAVAEVISQAMDTMNETMSNMPTLNDAAPTPDVTDMSKGKKQSIGERIRSLFKREPTDEAFSVFKGTDDQWHWHAVFTNNFEDLEGEILTEKAHDNYIARLDMGLVPMPLLDVWHIEGTEHGEADCIWRDGHFVHAVGHYDGTKDAEKAIRFYQKNRAKNSHAFVAPDWAFDGKHYDDYNTIKISTLPPHAAANPYTSFEELQAMTLTDEKRRYVEAIFGKEKLAEVEAADEKRAKALEDLKVAYKDFASTDTPKPKPESDKALTQVYMDIVQSQDELVQVVSLTAKALKAKDEQITALEKKFESETAEWQKALDDILAQLNAPPRRPSQDASTVKKEGEPLQNVIPADDKEAAFWGNVLKPKGAV